MIPGNVSVARRDRGFTLLELMIVAVIVAILAAIALPAYTTSVTKSKRRAAEACLSNYATYMERYYTTNLSYANAALPALDCASAANTGQNYTYGFTTPPTQSTYTLIATPIGTQAVNDVTCGALTLDQTGDREVLGPGTAASCW